MAYAFVRRQTTSNTDKADKILLALRTDGQPYYTGKYELVDSADFISAFGKQVVISVHDTFEEAKMFADMINKQREIDGG
jgi:ribosomal protein L31